MEDSDMDIPIQPIPVGIALIVLGVILILYIFPEVVKIFRVVLKMPKLPFAKKLITKIVLVIAGLFCIGLGLYLLFPIIPININGHSCVYAGKAQTDAEAITWLIESEAEAVLTEDMGLIQEIFTEKAIIVDLAANGGPTQKWNGPFERYQPLFAEHDFFNAKNTHIKSTGPINGDTVIYISGSQGDYTDNGQSMHYDHPIGASRWTLKKIDGCWKITNFEFNVIK